MTKIIKNIWIINTNKLSGNSQKEYFEKSYYVSIE